MSILLTGKEKAAHGHRNANKIAELEAETARLKHLVERQTALIRTVRIQPGDPVQRLVDALVEEPSRATGVGAACKAVGLSRAGFYRRRNRVRDMRETGNGQN